MRNKWEYKVIRVTLTDYTTKSEERQLDTLGDEGWELLSVAGPDVIRGGTAFLKREKPPPF